MVMCHLDYKNFHIENKELWVTSDDWNSDWCKMVNDNQSYCKALPIEKYKEFEGKCDEVNLPSFHPYWKVQIMLSDKKNYSELIEKYNECKEDNSKIKFLFNSSTQLSDIEIRVRKYIEPLNILKSLGL